MKNVCVCIALLATTIIIASDPKKPNPSVDQVKRIDRRTTNPSKIDKREGKYITKDYPKVMPPKPPKTKNPNS